MEVWCGMILGFDHDDETIFDAQLQFVTEARIISVMLGMLSAIPKTPLYDRLAAEGRLDTVGRARVRHQRHPAAPRPRTAPRRLRACPRRAQRPRRRTSTGWRTSTSTPGSTSAAGRTGTGGGTPGGWLKAKGLFSVQALGLLARLSWHVPDPSLRREYLRRVWRLAQGPPRPERALDLRRQVRPALSCAHDGPADGRRALSGGQHVLTTKRYLLRVIVMHIHLNRRQMLRAAAAVSAAGVLGATRTVAGSTPRFTVHERKVISPDAEYYHGWPTLCRRKTGELIVTWSGGREGHVCPFGRVEMMTSKDSGETWTFPRVLLDGAIDDRDSGCLETPRGTLIVTTFTSLAYESYQLDKQLALPEGDKARWPQEQIDRWLAVHNRLTPEAARAELGEWLIRSTDGGITWGPRIATVVNSPHGPIALGRGPSALSGQAALDRREEDRRGRVASTTGRPGAGWPRSRRAGAMPSRSAITNCTGWRSSPAGLSCRSATTTPPMPVKPCRPSRAMGARPGPSRTRLACGGCPRTSRNCATGGS